MSESPERSPPPPGERYTVRLADGSAYGPADLVVLKTWAAQGRVPAAARLEPVGGGNAVLAGEHPELAGAINAPPTMPGPYGHADPGTDATGGLIPYRNMPALIGYYLGVASLLGLVLWGVGVLISIPAIVMGVAGLRLRKRDPRVRGAGHAWAAIVLGSIMTLGHVALIVFVVVAVATAP